MRVLSSLSLVAAVSAKGRLATCSATGDPHYKPFAGGNRAKYTVMGEGEFTLAKCDDFKVSACSWDVSEGRKSTKKLTWNRDFYATDSGVKVLVDGGNSRQYKISVTQPNETPITHNLGLHTDPSTWACDAAAKGSLCKNIVNNKLVEVKLMRKRKAKKANKIVVKFKKTNRMVLATIASKTSKQSKFGKRTLFNIMVKVPKKDLKKEMTGLCGQSKTSMKQSKATIFQSLKSEEIPGCKVEVADQTTPDSQGTAELVEELVKTAPCNKDQASFAVQACSAVDTDDMMGCILDKLTGCDADGVDDLIDFEKTKIDYTCPVNSYISASTWPLVSFEDCDCMWGHTRDNEAETCTPKAQPVALPVTNGACFCDGTAPRHCMHNNDGHCMLPVLKSDGKTDCTDPSKALSAECTCSMGTTDCTGTKYHLHIAQQPNMANPRKPFGQQPVVHLVDANGNLIKDSKTKVRISIANVQDSSCACVGDKPCRHNNVGDSTCHSKFELFGDQVCPPGTSECLPGQSNTKLYQSIQEENPNDPESLESRSTQCRMLSATSNKLENFCSGMTPCKHQNDGSCVQKTAFYAQKIEKPKPVDTKICKGKEMWRRAVPSPVTGWFFETDSTCSMDKDTLGCTDASHSYAMDKWCEVNCNPKYPGQPAFCPPSHCDCSPTEAPKTEPSPDWRCPADRYDDGSCQCTPGTEFCGSIEVQLVNGVADCKHLTIGTEGRYQLLAEVIMPDWRTGSNNVRVLGKTGNFDVVTPKKTGTQCRAQAFWRKPAMYDSKAHGEGQAWHYDDSKKCNSRTATGACESVDKETTYAMDKWCKANNCAKHTLGSHCEFYTPDDKSTIETCASNNFDMFGDCCQVDQKVDACGVCGGDGSTCKVISYMSEPVAVSGATDIIFNASLAHPSCDMKSPCMHLNDKTCVPKTWNSATLVGEEQHCYWDRKARADEQPDWKYGTWDVEGRLSNSIETQKENGNNDCYCSAGTIDVSKKIEIEEKAKEDYLATLINQVEQIKKDNTDGEVPVEDVIIKNSMSAVAYDTAGCKGRTMKLSSIYTNTLCGEHFEGSDGKGSCHKGSTCCNDKIRSIYLPPMTTATIYEHCTAPGAANQVRYPSIENFGTTAKCIELEETSVSTIVIEGEVLKLEANVVGTPADCFESQCFEYVEKCKADAACVDVLLAAEADVAKGGNFIQAMQENMEGVSSAFSALVTCTGLAMDKCMPELAANPFTLPSVDDLKTKSPTTVQETVPIVPTPVPATAAPTDAPTATPTATPTAKPSNAPTVAVTGQPTAQPTNTPTAQPTNTPTSMPTNSPTVEPTSAFVKQVVNPSRFNAPNNIGDVTLVEPARLLCSCTSKPIVSTVTYTIRWESIFSRRLGVSGVVTPTAIVQVSSSGNQGIMGSTATSPASAAATGSATANVASSGGVGAAGTALIAVGCIGLVGALAAVAHSRKASTKELVGNSNTVTQKAATEDQTDVL